MIDTDGDGKMEMDELIAAISIVGSGASGVLLASQIAIVIVLARTARYRVIIARKKVKKELQDIMLLAKSQYDIGDVVLCQQKSDDIWCKVKISKMEVFESVPICCILYSVTGASISNAIIILEEHDFRSIEENKEICRREEQERQAIAAAPFKIGTEVHYMRDGVWSRDTQKIKNVIVLNKKEQRNSVKINNVHYYSLLSQSEYIYVIDFKKNICASCNRQMGQCNCGSRRAPVTEKMPVRMTVDSIRTVEVHSQILKEEEDLRIFNEQQEIIVQKEKEIKLIAGAPFKIGAHVFFNDVFNDIFIQNGKNTNKVRSKWREGDITRINVMSKQDNTFLHISNYTYAIQWTDESGGCTQSNTNVVKKWKIRTVEEHQKILEKEKKDQEFKDKRAKEIIAKRKVADEVGKF